jgi:hypothetical protein
MLIEVRTYAYRSLRLYATIIERTRILSNSRNVTARIQCSSTSRYISRARKTTITYTVYYPNNRRVS